jgi:hypothetical protein
MSNKYYQTYGAWKRSIKRIAKEYNIALIFEGDKDIDGAHLRVGDLLIIAEWDGASGVIEFC